MSTFERSNYWNKSLLRFLLFTFYIFEQDWTYCNFHSAKVDNWLSAQPFDSINVKIYILELRPHSLQWSDLMPDLWNHFVSKTTRFVVHCAEKVWNWMDPSSLRRIHLFIYIFISSFNLICDTRNGCDFYCDGPLSGRTSVGHLLDISSPNSFQSRIGLECNWKCMIRWNCFYLNFFIRSALICVVSIGFCVYLWFIWKTS